MHLRRRSRRASPPRAPRLALGRPVVVVDRRENVSLWRNVGAGTAERPAAIGSWLGIRLEQPGAANRDAIGAWVEVRAGDRSVKREVTVGGGHARPWTPPSP